MYCILMGCMLACAGTAYSMETKLKRADSEEVQAKLELKQELSGYVGGIGGIAGLIQDYLEPLPLPWETADKWLKKETVATNNQNVTSLQQLSPDRIACCLYPSSSICIYDLHDLSKPQRVIHARRLNNIQELVPYKDGFICTTSDRYGDARIWDLSQKSDDPAQVIKDTGLPVLFINKNLFATINQKLANLDSAHSKVQYDFYDVSKGSAQQISSLLVGLMEAESNQSQHMTQLSETAFVGVPDIRNIQLCFVDMSNPQDPKIATNLEKVVAPRLVIRQVAKISPTKIAILANAADVRKQVGEIVILDVADIYKPRIETTFRDPALALGSQMAVLSEDVVVVGGKGILQFWDITRTAKKNRLLATWSDNEYTTTLIPLQAEGSFARGTKTGFSIYTPDQAELIKHLKV